MSIINAIVQSVMDLGGGVFLPFTILILGIIFKQKPFDAIVYIVLPSRNS